MNQTPREFFEKLGLQEYHLMVVLEDGTKKTVKVYSDSRASAVEFVSNAHPTSVKVKIID